MKYIILDNCGQHCGSPIIFPDEIQHTDMAKYFGGKAHVVSAGQVSVYATSDEKVHFACSGKSISLDIGTRGELDSRVMARRFGVEI